MAWAWSEVLVLVWSVVVAWSLVWSVRLALVWSVVFRVVTRGSKVLALVWCVVVAGSKVLAAVSLSKAFKVAMPSSLMSSPLVGDVSGLCSRGRFMA